MIYSNPGSKEALVTFKDRYENFINGEWIKPAKGQYFLNVTPVTGTNICEVPRSSEEDLTLALDAAHNAKAAWAKTSTTERANILNKIADRIEQNLEMLAVAETWDNGKAVRETLAADLPLTADHFRYFASCIRAQEGGISEIDSNTIAYHHRDPGGAGVGRVLRPT